MESNNILVSRLQIQCLDELIARKGITYEAIKKYLIEKKLPLEINKLNTQYYDELFNMINAPDIRVGDTVHFLENCPSVIRYEQAFGTEYPLGLVLQVKNNPNCTGKLIVAKVSELRWVNLHEEEEKVSESWLKEGNPFVKKYGVSYPREAKLSIR